MSRSPANDHGLDGIVTDATRMSSKDRIAQLEQVVETQRRLIADLQARINGFEIDLRLEKLEP